MISCGRRTVSARYPGAPEKVLAISWMRRTPSDRSLTSEVIGGYPLDSSFVFNLYVHPPPIELSYDLFGTALAHHLQNVRSCTSLERVSSESMSAGTPQHLSNADGGGSKRRTDARPECARRRVHTALSNSATRPQPGQSRATRASPLFPPLLHLLSLLLVLRRARSK